MKAVLSGLLILVLASASSASAQLPADETQETRPPIRSAVELQLYNFGNFFQAPEGLPQRDVNAVGAAYRAAWRRAPAAPELYGRLSVLRYSGDASETSYGGQIGVSSYESAHWYDVYLEHTQNGYAFDTDETRASADITALRGHYSYAFTRHWRAGVDTYLEWQRFDVDAGFENDYQSLGAQLRYRGFGNLVQPQIGFVTGQRDVRNREDSHDDRYWYVQVTSRPLPRLTGTVRYRDRTREYANIDRTDDRDQWMLRAQFRQNDRLTWTASYTREAATSTRADRTFDADALYAGVIYAF